MGSQDQTDLSALCSLETFLQHEYDFLVIGGGTAGLVIAARLTENPNVHVGVLEAGPAHIGDPTIMMPALYTKLIGDPKYDWRHRTIGQKATNGKGVDWARGRCLGGSSAINYQMYVRGHAGDYDDWERLGNKGWAFKDLLPYFKKHEHFDDPKDYKAKFNISLETKYDADFHGKDGPIHTSFSTWRVPQEREWIAASSKLGDKMGSPMNAWSGDHLGSLHSLSTIDRSSGPGNGTRSYATTGYLLPNAARPNLRVLTEALVSKMIVSPDGSVTGVEFIHSEKAHTVQVKKEVVLSAGVVKSPQVLELSGIGNPDILSKAGVECIVENLRVGEHLQDHSGTGFGYELVEGEKSLDMLQDEATVQEAIEEYNKTRSGPLSSGGATMAFASFADLSTPGEIAHAQKLIMDSGDLDEESRKLLSRGLADPQDGSIQIVLLPASLNLDAVDDQAAFLGPPPDQVGKQGITLGTCVQRPLSVGTCHITSNNPQEDPEIDPGYLTHQADVEVIIKGLQLCEKMAATSPFKEKIKRRYCPDPSVDMSDHSAIEKYARAHCGTEYHPIGSVAMGKKGLGACDDRLRVYGCKGLRVVDASIIPLHVSGNIVSTVYTIAEKGADLIKEDWGL